MIETQVSIADDYAVLQNEELYFYYGYEHVWCLEHAKFTHRCGDDCETEWAFYAKKNGKVIAEYRTALNMDEFEVEKQLLHGLGKFIAEKLKF